MKKSQRDIMDSSRQITRRGLMLAGVQVATVTTLALKMRSMQLDHAEEYRMLADGNSIKMRLLPPARGLILDRNGMVIANNEQNYRVTLTREEAGGDVEPVLQRLAQLIPMSDARMDELRDEFAKRSAVTPIVLADRLSWEQFSAIAVNAPSLPGVMPESALSRAYVRGGDFAHVVGYVGPVSDYDLSRIEDPDPVLRLPDFQLGKIGVEGRMEEVLRGKAGARRVEVNSTGREMRQLSRQEGEQGATVQLTVDAALQNYAAQRMGEESAAAVVIDCRSGDLVSVCSSPSFDPNKFVRGISSKDYRALMDHDHRPLADKTVQGVYPPGSTFKMVTLLAGLESGVINAGSRYYCPGYTELGTRRFHCWRRGGHGSVDAITSLEQSCDVYYYELAQRVGIDRIAAMARKLGLGQRHDLPMSAVSEGIAPDRAWKKARYDQAWQIGDSLNASIGQGYVLASPMQLAVMTARIATGRQVSPALIRSIDGVRQDPAEAPPLDISDSSLRIARMGMEAVMNSSRGTARSSRITREDWHMAGKTGTSQVRNITAAERARGVVSNDQLPWNRRDHALFVCFAPYDAPRYAVSVVVEHGGGGSTVAAPIARDILLFALNGGLPPLDAVPSDQRAAMQARHEAMTLYTPDAPRPSRSRA
ncbi:penicillin-binding protein 2 [Paracoccus sp. 1_MG-2023]|uniref:penicillin-binding protein 2 n=1 Tax=unclassified Paracoccus (in: a-proteobacteria) TaxID=2688777 RepID=UPI001C097119|nr:MULTISPECIES: penicillin-binding protein 2 [unclassified Paracoccus (in: a-proteobacteria)]MBU2956480.1 penicillin-binding protein 2 [Paracoccus sp. C2R09]MDO6669716.1 penicillin-binding protein 2 [Paracoccus sp. 1_MG-2023]